MKIHLNRLIISLELIAALSIGVDLSAKPKNPESNQAKKIEAITYSSCSDCQTAYGFSCTKQLCNEISESIGENCTFYRRKNHLPNCADDFWGPDRSIYPWPRYK